MAETPKIEEQLAKLDITVRVMEKRDIFAAVAMHAMLTWRGEWEIEYITGTIRKTDVGLLVTAAYNVADEMLEESESPSYPTETMVKRFKDGKV